MGELLYLDYNCFQRGFDDARQSRIRMEAEACEQVFAQAERGSVELVWSFMHEDENRLCPFFDRKVEVVRLSALCRVRVGPSDSIRETARKLSAAGMPSKDSVHIAIAECTKAQAFLTCDDELVAKTSRLGGRLGIAVPVVNPVVYLSAGW